MQLTDQDGLHDALHLDALGQLIQRALVHARARLVHARHHVTQRQGVGQAFRGGGFGCGGVVDFGTEQGFESAA